MSTIGRRWSLAGSLFLCAVTCSAGAFVGAGKRKWYIMHLEVFIYMFYFSEYNWILIMLFLVGKMGITSSFTVIYVHTAELLPTVCTI